MPEVNVTGIQKAIAAGVSAQLAVQQSARDTAAKIAAEREAAAAKPAEKRER